MISYKIATTEKEITEVCKQGLASKLHYIGYGEMRDMYRSPEKITVAIIAYDGSKPVGVCLKGSEIHYRYDVALYVHEDYRRQGIGTKLVKASDHVYKATNPEQDRAMSNGFFMSLGYVDRDERFDPFF